ncbi:MULTISPECIES: DUF6714 family protein [unclassified Microcoleus]|uniref:DUF6714 family protein n=1 Tax=unclassified Microcoleus TaxID=2642155 RepID=UPI002FD44790
MQHCDELKNQLLDFVRAAFSDNKLIHTQQISAADSNLSFEYEYCQKFFNARKWQDISCSELLNEYPSGVSAALTFLSDAEFNYYLPIFMYCSVAEFEVAGELTESLLSELNSCKPHENSIAQGQKFHALNNLQKKCVAEYLVYLATCRSSFYPIETHKDLAPSKLLADYWNQFLTL